MKRIKTITFLLFTIIYGFVNCQNETNKELIITPLDINMEHVTMFMEVTMVVFGMVIVM